MSIYKGVFIAINDYKDTNIHKNMYNSSIDNNRHAKYLPFFLAYYIGFYRPQQTTDIYFSSLVLYLKKY